MGERYAKLFTGDEILYFDGAPVVIRARALLKDTQTGKLLAQLKFQNVSGKLVSYVKVAIAQHDAVHNVLAEEVSFEYLDLSVADKEQFGSKTPIPIPNASTRSFGVGISYVGFADGSVWTSDPAEWKAAGNDSEIAKVLAVEDTYAQALALSASANRQDVAKAKEIFERIQTEKDVATEMALCDEKIAQFDAAEAAKPQKRKKKITIAVITAVACVLFACFVGVPLVPALQGNYSVFISMYKVKNFRVPNGVTSIKENAFSLCTSLESVTIPDGVTSIDDRAFWNCTNLTSVTIPDSVASIGDYAFENCKRLTGVTIPDSVTDIEEGAFLNCKSLTSVTIPSGVTNMGDSVFTGCKSLTSVTISDGVTSMGDCAFRGCTNLTSVTIPDSVMSIGSNAFERCKRLAGITIPDSVMSIGDWAFEECTSLTSITIPDSVWSVGHMAFMNCTSLTSITVPDGVTNMGDGAFEGCSADIYFGGTKTQWNELYYAYDGNVHCSDGTITG